MANWLLYFPLEQIQVINGDSFIHAPWKQLKTVEKFLGIDHVITEDNFVFNATKGFYCGKDVRQRGVWTCSKEKCLSKAKGRKKPPVEEGTANRLRAFFQPNNLKLFKMINQTFDWQVGP